MPPRIALPALLSVALLTAGCVGGPVGSADQPTATTFPGGTTELPDGPKERPDRPETLNESSVGEYVKTFEYRYAYNSLHYSEHSEVHVECEVDSVEQRASGYAATVTCYGYSNTGGDADGTASPTVLHADWGSQTFTYHVDGDATRRLDGDGEPTGTDVPNGE
ncbi:hypothetical protein [Halorarius halobius]|uniref:hypothetical protein n=1 Tax=Halorarius halobius TaxID=2962671 RepID=UPI0020CB91B3|nr:hypothetical protein [Halorarius halobius]